MRRSLSPFSTFKAGFTPHRDHVPPSLMELFISWGLLLVFSFFSHDLTLSSCFRCQKPAGAQQGQAMAESPKICSLILRPLPIIKVVLWHGKAIPWSRLKTQTRLLARKTSRHLFCTVVLETGKELSHKLSVHRQLWNNLWGRQPLFYMWISRMQLELSSSFCQPAANNFWSWNLTYYPGKYEPQRALSHRGEPRRGLTRGNK